MNVLTKCIYLMLLIASLKLQPCYGQSRAEIDAMNSKAELYRDTNTDSLEIFAELALEQSRLLNYPKGQFDALLNKGFSKYLRGNYDLAVKLYVEALDIAERYPNIELDRAGIHNFIGLAKIELGQFHEAVEHFMPVIDYATKLHDDFLLTDACSNIGLSYLNARDYKKAAKYYRTALNIHERIDNPHGRVYVLMNYGRIFFDQNRYDSAQLYLEESLELSYQINSERARYYALAQLSSIPTLPKSDLEKYMLEALELSYKFKMNREQLRTHISLAELYLNTGKYDLCIQNARNGQKIAENFDDKSSLQEIYNLLIRAYTIKEEFTNADIYVKRYDQLLDSLSQDKSNYVKGLVGINEMMEEERNYEAVKGQLNEARDKIQRKNTVIITIVLIAILIVFLLIVTIKASRHKTKTNLQLATLNEQLDNSIKEKDLLLSMIVHDLRSPLDQVYGLTEVFKATMSLSTEHREVIEMMQKIILDTKYLTEELLEVNRLESGQSTVKNEFVEVRTFLSELISQHQVHAEKKNIQVELETNMDKSVIKTDRTMFNRIVENLYSNAIKFTPMNGNIKIHVHSNSKLITVKVKDSGPGIRAEEQKLLFKKFSKASNRPTANEVSTGLGLYIVKTLVNELKGTVRLSSEPGQGAEFTVEIPIE